MSSVNGDDPIFSGRSLRSDTAPHAVTAWTSAIRRADTVRYLSRLPSPLRFQASRRRARAATLEPRASVKSRGPGWCRAQQRLARAPRAVARMTGRSARSVMPCPRRPVGDHAIISSAGSRAVRPRVAFAGSPAGGRPRRLAIRARPLRLRRAVVVPDPCWGKMLRPPRQLRRRAGGAADPRPMARPSSPRRRSCPVRRLGGARSAAMARPHAAAWTAGPALQPVPSAYGAWWTTSTSRRLRVGGGQRLLRRHGSRSRGCGPGRSPMVQRRPPGAKSFQHAIEHIASYLAACQLWHPISSLGSRARRAGLPPLSRRVGEAATVAGVGVASATLLDHHAPARRGPRVAPRARLSRIRSAFRRPVIASSTGASRSDLFRASGTCCSALRASAAPGVHSPVSEDERARCARAPPEARSRGEQRFTETLDVRDRRCAR